MSRVRVRFFQCLTRMDEWDVPEVSGISSPIDEDVGVNLARAISVNALATPAPTRARYTTLRHEARLLASLLTDERNVSAAPRLRLASAFPASARHIRGFVAEGAGLGLLTSAAEEFLHWRPDPALLAHFDALPTSLVSQYGKNGPRPDLLFDLGDGLEPLAGEAKGRSRKPPKTVLREQVRALNKLLRWSHNNKDHPIVLSFAFLTENGITVDLFSLTHGSRSPVRKLLLRHERGEWSTDTISPDPEHEGVIEQARRDEAVIRARQNARRQRDRIVDDDTWPVSTSNEEDLPVDRVTVEAREGASVVEDRLYTDARRLQNVTRRDSLLGTEVIGSWTPLDLFGETGRFLYFGALDRGLGAEELSRFRKGRSERQAEELLMEVDVTSRIVVGVTTRPVASPPAWEAVREVVERD